jgi:NAD(P)-dependent dehydrogenase (short-subunit alcohol dehydrogenase family)
MISGARDVAPAMVAAMEANVPMKFLGAPSDVASMNLFLASDESRYVTGAEFVVDGGLTAK